MKFVQSYYLARFLYKQTLEIQNYAVIFLLPLPSFQGGAQIQNTRMTSFSLPSQ